MIKTGFSKLQEAKNCCGQREFPTDLLGQNVSSVSISVCWNHLSGGLSSGKKLPPLLEESSLVADPLKINVGITQECVNLFSGQINDLRST